MNETQRRFPVIREAVASFPDRPSFERAVSGLLAAGFKPSDLSVLASHDSLEVAGRVAGYPGTPKEDLVAGLNDEIKYIAPLTIAGIIMLTGGPIAAGIAAIVGAGLGGAALKEVLDQYSAANHSAEFAAALKAGAILLWARTEDPELEAPALRIMEEAGGRNAHIHGRSARGEAR